MGAKRELDQTVKDKLRLWFLLLAFVATGVSASIAYRFSHEWMMVDRCLSALHGSFDYSSMKCDLETNHPYVPYRARHPRDKQIAVVAFVSFAVFISGYCWSKNPSQKK